MNCEGKTHFHELNSIVNACVVTSALQSYEVTLWVCVWAEFGESLAKCAGVCVWSEVRGTEGRDCNKYNRQSETEDLQWDV